MTRPACSAWRGKPVEGPQSDKSPRQVKNAAAKPGCVENEIAGHLHMILCKFGAAGAVGYVRGAETSECAEAADAAASNQLIPFEECDKEFMIDVNHQRQLFWYGRS